jgi:hypothetical protein
MTTDMDDDMEWGVHFTPPDLPIDAAGEEAWARDLVNLEKMYGGPLLEPMLSQFRKKWEESRNYHIEYWRRWPFRRSKT